MVPLVYAAAFSAAAVLSLGAVHMTRRLSLRLGAVDRGGGRRVHQGTIPRLGGVGIYLVWAGITVASLAAFGDKAQTAPLVGILLGSLLLLAVGVYDDIRSASVRLKIGVQVVAALLVFSFGVRISVLSNPVGEVFRPGLLELPFTVLWLVVITNAYNLIDGIDGLAAATGISICAGMVLLYTGGDSLGRIAIVTLAGALAGFLRHNFPPARVFMGDSGSQSVGFLLGALSLLSFAKASTLAALVLPLVVFGHPLVDLAYAVLRRYHRGLPLGVADREHLHHLLLDWGYTGRTALGLLVLMNLGLLVLVLCLAGSQYLGVAALLTLLTIPAGIAVRLARHVYAGGSVGKEARAFFKSAEQRRALYRERLFRNSALAADARTGLDGLIRTFSARTGVRGVRITLRGAGRGDQLLFADAVPAAALRSHVCVTVVGEASGFELLDVSANREGAELANLSVAIHALASGVRDYLESEAAVPRSGQLAAVARPSADDGCPPGRVQEC